MTSLTAGTAKALGLGVCIAALLGMTATAHAGGPLTVKKNVPRFGFVNSADGGIDCNPLCVSDTETYPDVCEPNPNPPPPEICTPPVVTVQATPRPDGFAFVSWTGCDDATDDVCEQTIDAAPESITANFQDIVDPTVSIASPPPDAVVNDEFEFTADAADNDVVAQVRFVINGVTFTDTQPPFSTIVNSENPPFHEGVNTLSVRAFDFSSRPSALASEQITVDNTPPGVTISGPSGTTDDTTPSFSFTVSDPTAVAECRLDTPNTEPPFAGCASPQSFGPLVDGDYEFEVRATDQVGNQATATRRFSVDTDPSADRPPQTRITKAPKRKGERRKVKFRFKSDEPGSSFECKLDRKRYKPCSSPFKKRVSFGKHKFKVRAIDESGLVDPRPAKKRFRVRR